MCHMLISCPKVKEKIWEGSLSQRSFQTFQTEGLSRGCLNMRLNWCWVRLSIWRQSVQYFLHEYLVLGPSAHHWGSSEPAGYLHMCGGGGCWPVCVWECEHCICVYMWVCVWKCVCVWCAWMCVWEHVCDVKVSIVYVCACEHVSVCVCVWACVCVRVSVCVCWNSTHRISGMDPQMKQICSGLKRMIDALGWKGHCQGFPQPISTFIDNCVTLLLTTK